MPALECSRDLVIFKVQKMFGIFLIFFFLELFEELYHRDEITFFPNLKLAILLIFFLEKKSVNFFKIWKNYKIIIFSDLKQIWLATLELNTYQKND